MFTKHRFFYCNYPIKPYKIKGALIIFILFLLPSLIYLCAKMFLFDVMSLALYFGYSFGFSVISVIIYELTCKILSKHREKYRKLYEAELKEKANK